LHVDISMVEDLELQSILGKWNHACRSKSS